MKRFLAIAVSRFKDISLHEFFSLLKSSLYRNDVIFVYRFRISRYKEKSKESSNHVEVRKGQIHELDKFTAKFHPIPWEFRCHIYDGVEDFFIACGNNRIQHISWIYYKNQPNRLLKLGPGDAEIKYCLTLPGCRGRGLYPAVLNNIIEFLKKSGYKHSYICVHRDNSPSIRGVEKAGFQFHRKLRLLKIMGIQCSRRYNPRGQLKNGGDTRNL